MSKTRTFLYFYLHYIIYLSVHSLRIRNNVVIDIITHLLAVNIWVADTLPNSSVSETSAKRTKYIYIHVYIDIFCTIRGGFTTWRIRQSVGNPNIFLNHATDSSAATAVTRAARAGGEQERTNRGANDAVLYTLLSLVLMTYSSFYKLIISCIRHWRTINLQVSLFVSIEFLVLLRIYLALTEYKIRIIGGSTVTPLDR